MINYIILITSIIITTSIALLSIYIFNKYISLRSSKSYIKQKDKNEQEKYTQSKYTIQDTLSIQEVTRLSWKFLHDIAQIVLKKFSYEEQNMLINIGTKLYNLGMRYRHEINPEVISKNYNKSRTANKTTQRSK